MIRKSFCFGSSTFFSHDYSSKMPPQISDEQFVMYEYSHPYSLKWADKCESLSIFLYVLTNTSDFFAIWKHAFNSSKLHLRRSGKAKSSNSNVLYKYCSISLYGMQCKTLFCIWKIIRTKNKQEYNLTCYWYAGLKLWKLFMVEGGFLNRQQAY